MQLRSRLAAVLGFAVVAATIAAVPATANPAGTGLVINEVYGGGGNSGAAYRSDFIELYNPTGSAISTSGLSVQYRSTSGGAGGAAVALSGSVPAHGYYLIKAADGTNTGLPALPTPDATTTFTMSATAGQVLLINGTSFSGTGNVAGNPSLVDMVGYGTGNNTFEGATMSANLTNATSASRTSGADTNNNSADFTSGAPSPQNSGGGSGGGGTGGEKTIAEIQGTGATSPLAGQTVTTKGIVTATYPTGGFNGIYIQTPGTGGGADATPGASDAIFVFGSSSGASTVALGDYVQVTGAVSEFSGLTEITPAAGGVVPASGTAAPVTPLAAAYPTTEAAREAHEGELLAPTDTFTVTDTYSTNQYAEIGLATGTKPLIVPTEVADAQDSAAIAAVNADNAARGVVLDDGASINFLSNATNKAIPLPWLAPSNPVRVGARATFNAPVILDWRNSVWKFQPQQRVTDTGSSVVSFQNTRSTSPEAVPGNLHLATFNVLNYFNTVGVDYVASGHSCTFYLDRDGNKNTVNDCGATGPRGAAEADDLTRQQTKIVAAINALGADVVSLEEVENSVALGEPNRDDALATLVDALNVAAGTNRWAYAPSPSAADLPPTSEQDVIRTAFIYNPATVSLVGASKVLVGSPAFANAREPLAQAFKPAGAGAASTFAVVVNHFKSKGSGIDDGTGQGNANPDRIAQAQALIPFANDFAASRGTDKLFLAGDFNSYSQEDPIQVLQGAGFSLVNSDDPNEWTYSFGGQSGSLDHVLANPAARGLVAGADIWSINSGESVAWEYSRTNYNVSDFYQPNMFRASDHDPEIVGLNIAAAPQPVTVTADDKTITYGDADPAFTFTSTGFAPGDGFTAQPTCGVEGAHSNAGSYPIVCSGGDPGDGYSASYVAGTLTVRKAVLTVTADPATRAYGAPNPPFTATVTGYVAGDGPAVVSGSPAFTTTATPASAPGTYPISPSQGTLSADNYTFDFVDGVLTVTRSAVTVTAEDKTITYGEADPAFTFTSTGFAPGDGFVIEPTCDVEGPHTNAGTYMIVCSGGDAGPGYDVSYVAGTLTVKPAVLTVTANPATRVYGAPNPAFSATITGYVAGDTSSVVSGAPAFSTTATTASHPGSYPISVSQGTLVADNYTFAFADGVLTVAQAPVTITAQNVSMLQSLLTGRFSFTGTVRNAVTGAPAVGVPVTAVARDLLGRTLSCTGITDATGSVSCRSTGTLLLVVVPPRYTATSSATLDYKAGVTSGTVTL